MTGPGDGRLLAYSLEVERLELALDHALAGIRDRERDGSLIALEAANERVKVLTGHLDARKALSDQFWGQDPAR